MSDVALWLNGVNKREVNVTCQKLWKLYVYCCVVAETGPAAALGHIDADISDASGVEYIIVDEGLTQLTAALL